MKNAVIDGEKYLKSVVSMEKVSPREGHPRSGIRNNLSIKSRHGTTDPRYGRPSRICDKFSLGLFNVIRDCIKLALLSSEGSRGPFNIYQSESSYNQSCLVHLRFPALFVA